jgi:hypothetical protein
VYSRISEIIKSRIYGSYIDTKLNAEVLFKNSAVAIYSRLDPKYSSKDTPVTGWRILNEEQERRICRRRIGGMILLAEIP